MTAPERFALTSLVRCAGRHRVAQDTLAEHMRDRLRPLPGSKHWVQMIGFVYEHAYIDSRHFEIAPAEIDERTDWYAMANRATESLATRALERLFEREDVAALDGLVCVSSTFAGFPGLSRRLQDELPFRPEVVCFDLAALGCAAPTEALVLAHMLIETGRCRRVCVVCADAMGTFGRARRFTRVPEMNEIVAHCLASDGAAAAVVAGDPDEPALLSFGGVRLSSRLWPSSIDQNDLTATSDNEPFLSVGKEIRTRLEDELAAFLDDDLVSAPMLLHPGGAALMRIVREAYPEMAGSVALSSAVLRESGNIGSPSVLWVLDRALAEGFELTPRFSLFAIGPGLVSTALTFREVQR